MEPLSVQGGARHDCCSASAIAAPVAHSVRACQHRLPHALAQTPGDRREANRRALQLHGAGWSAEGPTHPLSPQRVGASPKSLLNPAPPGQCSRAAHILGGGKRAAPTSLPCRNEAINPGRYHGRVREVDLSLAMAYHFRLTDLPGRPSWPPRRCRRLRPRRQSKDRRGGGSEQPKPKSRRIACQYGSHSGGSQTGDRNAMGGGERVRVGGREPWAAARLCFCAGRRPGLNAGYLCHLCLGNLWAVEPPAVAPTNRQRGGSPGGYSRGYPRDTQGIAAAFCRAGTHLAEPCASRALHI